MKEQDKPIIPSLKFKAIQHTDWLELLEERGLIEHDERNRRDYSKPSTREL